MASVITTKYGVIKFPDKDRLLDIDDVMHMVNLSRSAVYLYIKKKLLPEPFQFGGRCIIWLESDIQNWLKEEDKNG